MTSQSPIVYKPKRRRPPVLLVLGMLAIVVVMIGGGIAAGMLLASQTDTAASQPRALPAPVQTQSAQVYSYGWTNREVGAAHIPVERAMQIIASQGMPQLQELPATPVPTPAPGSDLPGAGLFTQLGCNACHGEADSALAPTLRGILGAQVRLADGQTVTADEAYIKESILNPQVKVVEGYQPVMPSFEGRVSEEQLNQLVEYIQSLRGS
jgi:mono/diheme cytochrome c family protein